MPVCDVLFSVFVEECAENCFVFCFYVTCECVSCSVHVVFFNVIDVCAFV